MKNDTSIRAELKVSRKEIISPHFIRVYLTGEKVSEFSQAVLGNNNKIFIPPKGSTKVVFPEYDYEKRQWKEQPAGTKCAVRTYTHRGIDLQKNEMWIDFVSHGDEGPASAWAASAAPGDLLGVSMRTGDFELFPRVQHYLLAGDATALPVLSVILENLPSGSKGTCIIEVHGPLDTQLIKTAADINFIWLYNPEPQKGSSIAETVKAQSLPVESRFSYVAAEFSTVKEVRRYLRKEKNWQQNELDAYSYWKIGTAEDRSAGERHAESRD